MTLAAHLIRADFPMLLQTVHDQPILYFDNAATTFKPSSVIEAMNQFYSNHYGTVHRAIYPLAQQTTTLYHQVRQKVRQWIGASLDEEIIFTSGTTDGLNKLALSMGEAYIRPGDEILISEIEHHSNFVPWQMLANRKGAHLKFIPILKSGDIDLEALKAFLNPNTKIVSLAHVSNVMGTIHPISKIIPLVRAHSSAKIVIDGAQAVSHMPIDVKVLDADFYLFSAHKMYGPTGVGVLYGKKELLEELPPVFGGGDMIEEVSLEATTYNKLPYKFEAGTPNIAGVLGLGAAIDYMHRIGIEEIQQIEHKLLEASYEKLSKVPGVHIIANPKERAALISFYVENAHSLDVATLLSFKGVALRSGHLCAQPALKHLNLSSVLRISFACYNTTDEIDLFIQALEQVITKLST